MSDEADAAKAQEERALQAIRNIQAGSNVTYEAYMLANEFTDSHTARFMAWLRRVFRRPSAK